MTEEEAKKWAKERTNQDRVVARFFKDHKPTKMKLAFFMAGIPGAGKTEFAENTINETKPKLVPIEHDKLVEYIDGYRPEHYYDYRKAGSILVTRILEESLSHGYSFIFDGTLSHEGGYRNIEKTLKKGYFVQIVYIVQSAKVAWQLTQDRELVKKRAIEKTGFIDTCNKINKNLALIFERFKMREGFGFWIFDKNGRQAVSEATSIIYATATKGVRPQVGMAEQVEKALSATYNIEELE